MASILLNGNDVEIVRDDDWTTTETTNAEKALGIDYFAGTGMEQMKVVIFVSAMRADPTLEPVPLADAVGQMKLGVLAELARNVEGEEEEAPLETPFGPALPETVSGLPSSDNSESLSHTVS